MGILYIYICIHVRVSICLFVYLINNPIYIYLYLTTNHIYIYIYGRLGGLKDLGIGLPFHVSNVGNSSNCSWKTIDDFHHV